MSREEAATVYLDNLLGFSGNYRKVIQAERALTTGDKELLRAAVSGWMRDDALRNRRGPRPRSNGHQTG